MQKNMPVENKTETISSKSASEDKGRKVLDWIIFGVCLAVLACRTTVSEGLTNSPAIKDATFNVLMTVALLASMCAWLVWNLRLKEFKYRFSGIEIGAGLMIIAGVISYFEASNKRDAITSTISLIVPLIAAILMVQLLNSQARIKMLLYVVAAFGAVNAVECADQYFNSNEAMITEYKTDPDAMLARMNIEKGSFAQMLFEHRLYSKDVRGYFITGNSAGSFFILAIAAAAALVYEKRKNSAGKAGSAGELVARILVLGVIAGGLVLTHSKGATAAAILAATVAAVLLLFGQKLARHKRLVIAVCAGAAVATAAAFIWYGINHETLPGGKSMLVRWQYWVGAARIMEEHPLGIGAGNFGTAYQKYKIPAGLETVKDPHNFLLSIGAQLGVVGLAGFAAAILVLFYHFARGGLQNGQPEHKGIFRQYSLLMILILGLILLLMRPMALDIQMGDSPMVKAYIVFWLIALPAAVFAGAVMMLSTNEKSHTIDRTVGIVVLCSVTGVILHNLVDFAIFEQGVSLCMWMLAATVIAMRFNSKAVTERTIRLGTGLSCAAVIAVFGVLWAYLHFGARPVVAAAYINNEVAKFAEPAMKYAATDSNEGNKPALIQTTFAYAYKRLAEAADQDTLSPDVPYIGARLALQAYEELEPKNKKFLEWAHNQILKAIERDPDDFKNYEKLAEVFEMMSAKAENDVKKADYLKSARAAIEKAVECYPGSDRLRVQAGKIAEKMGDKAAAVEHFKKAIEIEDAYRVQFKKMYPSKPVFSRLGEKDYQFAIRELGELTQNTTKQ